MKNRISPKQNQINWDTTSLYSPVSSTWVALAIKTKPIVQRRIINTMRKILYPFFIGSSLLIIIYSSASLLVISDFLIDLMGILAIKAGTNSPFCSEGVLVI